MHRFHAVSDRAAPDASAGWGHGAGPRSRTAWRGVWRKPSLTDPGGEGGEKNLKKEGGFGAKEPPRPGGPKNAPGKVDRSTQGHGEGDVQKLKTSNVRPVLTPSVSHSLCLF